MSHVRADTLGVKVWARSASSERRPRNAIFHATGKRVRELPITIDKLLD